MINKIKAKGVQTVFVTLHVGSGTFQPVRVENLSEHLMHKEYLPCHKQLLMQYVKPETEAGGSLPSVRRQSGHWNPHLKASA